MRRFFLIALGAGLVALVVALLAIGAFPPHPAVHAVERKLPNSAFTAQ